MRALALVFLSFTLVFLGYQVYRFEREGVVQRSDFSEAKSRFEKAEATRDDLKAQVQFLERPENLEKELRYRLHYRLPDEKLLIVVPKNDDVATSSNN